MYEVIVFVNMMVTGNVKISAMATCSVKLCGKRRKHRGDKTEFGYV